MLTHYKYPKTRQISEKIYGKACDNACDNVFKLR